MGCVCSHARSGDSDDAAVDAAATTPGPFKPADTAHPADSPAACFVLESSRADPTINTATTDNDTSHSSQSSSIMTADHPLLSTAKPSSSSMSSSAAWIHDLDGDALLATIAIPYDCLLLQTSSRPAGVFGNVHRGTYQAMAVVVHRLDASKLNERRLRIFKDDIHLLMRLQHPNIVQFIGASWTAPPTSSTACCCLVMEYPQRGDLFSMLRSSKYKLTWQKNLLRIATDVATGMAYLHARDPPVLHRDLQSMHVHVSSNYVGKIADIASTPSQGSGGSGSRWMAPERILGGEYGGQADVYSFGILLSEMDTSKIPYEEMARHRPTKYTSMEKATGASTELLRRIATEGLRPQMAVNGLASVRALFTRCVSADPSERPTFDEIVTFLKQDVQDEVNVRFPPTGGLFWPS